MSTAETPLLTLTERAAAKVKALMADEPEGEVGVLRVAIHGGSCSGLEYALGFDQEALEGDLVTVQHGVEVVVDPYSAPYLEGATVDLVSVRDEEGFTIENPNTLHSSCGCGSSFRAEGETDAATDCGGNCGC
ncbi:MAG: iron-sulfur cluster assembly accessory protein [Gaiellaceae bacterium]|jgi:iron-sulfur cluster assembly protein